MGAPARDHGPRAFRPHTLRLLCLLVAAIAVPARAEGVLEVDSNVPATVFMDGEALGDTPLKIVSDQPGEHEVRIEATGRRDVRHYRFLVPRVATVVRTMKFEFPQTEETAAAPAAVYTPPRVMERAVKTPERVMPRAEAPGPAAAVTPPRRMVAPAKVEAPTPVEIARDTLPAKVTEEARRRAVLEDYRRRAAALDPINSLPPRSTWNDAAPAPRFGVYDAQPAVVAAPAPVAPRRRAPRQAPPSPVEKPIQLARAYRPAYRPMARVRTAFIAPAFAGGVYYGGYAGYGYGGFIPPVNVAPPPLPPPPAVNYEPASAYAVPGAALFRGNVSPGRLTSD